MHSVEIHEDILRHLWSSQYLEAERLTTIDGRMLKVVSPGVLNRESGPDFRDGVIVLDGQTYRGDIEFHRTANDWFVHFHNTDPKYNSVILHVVLHRGPGAGATIAACGRQIPVLALDGFLSSPLEKVVEHAVRDEHLSRAAPLRCLGRNENVGFDVLARWIQTLFRERLTEKAVRMFRRLVEIIEEGRQRVSEPSEKYNAARGDENPDDIPEPDAHVGEEELRCTDAWEQLLYEGLMDGLGYSKNRIPFAALALRVTVQYLRPPSFPSALTELELEAILLHSSGLLPEIHLLRDQESKIRLHQLHTAWNTLAEGPGLRNLLAAEPMHAAEWVFSPTRPANFPTARIAAASALLGRILYHGLLARLVTIMRDSSCSAQETLSLLCGALAIGEDPFWSFHYSFIESSPRRHLLLGDARKHDIIVNTILPLSSLYAYVFGMESMNEHVMNVAAAAPLLENNFITRKMEKQLLKGRSLPSSALEQQGIIQLYKRYCYPERCGECEVGKNCLPGTMNA